jgi:glycosyltransferase involved in cell wall biosynthesis
MSLSGGVKIILEYAEFLRLQGHDVTCFHPAPRRPSLKERLRALIRKRASFTVSTPRGHLWGKELRVLRSRYSGAASMTDIPDADIVVASWWETAEWIATLPPSKGKKCHFVQDHEIFPGQPVDRVRAVYRSGLTTFTVSRWLAETLKSEYGIDDIVVIPNGVQTDRFHPHQSPARNPITIGHLWSYTPRKNSLMAVEAMRIARKEMPDLRGMFFGGDKDPVDIRDIEWIEYAHSPLQSEIPAHYAQCRCWLFTSITEGFGLPLLEALASGTPVIATRAGAAPDLIDEGNGRLVEGTAEAMAAAILDVARLTEDDWQAMSKHARGVAEKHDWIMSARKFEMELKAVAGQD